MSVSMGFFKRIQQWVVDKSSGNIEFLPFQAAGNPYKSKVFLVGANTEPFLQLDVKDLDVFADSLVDADLFAEVFHEEIMAAPREYKGSLNLVTWMKEHLNENVVLTSVNCLISDDVRLKQLKKSEDPVYLQGFEVFEEVLNEFEPEILIVQGTSAFKLFLEQFEEQLIDFNKEYSGSTVQQLEQKGIIANYRLKSGKFVNIVVCRSMGYFGKEGKSFGEFKETIKQLL